MNALILAGLVSIGPVREASIAWIALVTMDGVVRSADDHDDHDAAAADADGADGGGCAAEVSGSCTSGKSLAHLLN